MDDYAWNVLKRLVLWADVQNAWYAVEAIIDGNCSSGKLLTGVGGQAWEKEVARICKDLQLEVTDRSREGLTWDLEIAGLRTQCKFTGARGKADLRGDGHRGRYKMTDFDVLALKVRNMRFVVPVGVLIDRRNPEFLVERWQPSQEYEDNWQIFSCRKRYGEFRQQTLFGT